MMTSSYRLFLRELSLADRPRARLAAALLLLAAPLFAGPGTTSGDFLRIQTSPRSVGMGESGVALSDDLLTATSLNPAGLGRLNYTEAALTYDQFYQGLTMSHGSFALPTRKYGVFGISGTVFRSEPFAGYDNSGSRTTDVNVREFAVTSLYARRLWGPAEDKPMGLFAGAAASFARSTLFKVTANYALADAGFIYVHRMDHGVGSIGGSVHALGSGPRYDIQREKAPSVYRGGLAYSQYILGDPLTVAWDVKKPSDEKLSHGVGFEYALKRVLYWRMGYASHQDLGSGFRFGVGFKLRVFTVDYALSHYGNFGLTHLIGFSVKFGEPQDATPIFTDDERRANNHVKRGKAMLERGQLYDAAVEFDQALRLDHHNKEAIRLLRLVRERMEGSK